MPVKVCILCANHNVEQLERVTAENHTCPYTACACLLCELSRAARLAMRRQQEVWRHQLGELANNEEFRANRMAQHCVKCRNHGIFKEKRGHRGECEHQNCVCDLCTLTDRRRDIMVQVQRVRRAKIISGAEGEVPE